MGSGGAESEEHSLMELLPLVDRVPTLRINNADRGLSLRLVDAVNSQPAFLKAAHERAAASAAVQEAQAKLEAANEGVRPQEPCWGRGAVGRTGREAGGGHCARRAGGKGRGCGKFCEGG